MVPYVDDWTIPQCRDFMRNQVIRPKCHVMWLRFDFKSMLITDLVNRL